MVLQVVMGTNGVQRTVYLGLFLVCCSPYSPRQYRWASPAVPVLLRISLTLPQKHIRLNPSAPLLPTFTFRLPF